MNRLIKQKPRIITSATALALSITPLISMADMTLYGDFRASLTSISNEDSSTALDGLQFVNNASRVGIKGGYTEGSLTSFYHLQMGLNNEYTSGIGADVVTSRFFFAGIKGDFGKVTFGNTSTPYKLAGLKLDPFYDTTAGAGNAGASYGLSPFTNGFTNNSVAYTNKFGPLVFDAALYVEENDTDGGADGEADADHDTNLGLTYVSDSWKAGVQTLSFGDNVTVAASGGFGANVADDSITRVFGSYAKDAVSVGASFEQTGDFDSSYTYLSGTYQLSKKTKLAANLGSVAGDDVDEGNGFTVGAFHNLLKKTTVHVLFSQVNTDAEVGRSVASVGIKQQF